MYYNFIDISISVVCDRVGSFQLFSRDVASSLVLLRVSAIVLWNGQENRVFFSDVLVFQCNRGNI